MPLSGFISVNTLLRCGPFATGSRRAVNSTMVPVTPCCGANVAKATVGLKAASTSVPRVTDTIALGEPTLAPLVSDDRRGPDFVTGRNRCQGVCFVWNEGALPTRMVGFLAPSAYPTST